MTLKKYDFDGPEASKVDVAAFDFANYREEDLLLLRERLDGLLQVELKHLNLTEELGLQYRQGKALLDKVKHDDSVPANQKAQMYNSTMSMLEKIVKMQESVYSMERLKRYESAVVKALEGLPDASKEAFFDLYGEYLQDVQ